MFTLKDVNYVETVLQEDERIVGYKLEDHGDREQFQFIIAKGFDLTAIKVLVNKLSQYLLFSVHKYL